MTAPQLLDAPAIPTDDDDVCHIVCCRDNDRAFCAAPVADAQNAPDDTPADCPLCNVVYDDLAACECPFGGWCPDHVCEEYR